jgi:hypothetical protein
MIPVTAVPAKFLSNARPLILCDIRSLLFQLAIGLPAKCVVWSDASGDGKVYITARPKNERSVVRGYLPIFVEARVGASI